MSLAMEYTTEQTVVVAGGQTLMLSTFTERIPI